MYKYKAYLYKDENGKSEINSFIEKLQNSKSKDEIVLVNKIILYIRYLKEKGLSLGEPYIKHITEDIWELRPKKVRIFFSYIGDNNFILLSYFVKKTKRTPIREIINAKKILKNIKKR